MTVWCRLLFTAGQAPATTAKTTLMKSARWLAARLVSVDPVTLYRQQANRLKQQGS
jgi:hypothetical protein